VISLIEAESGCPTPTSEKGWLVFKNYLDCLFRNRHWLAIAIDVSKKMAGDGIQKTNSQWSGKDWRGYYDDPAATAFFEMSSG